MSAGRGLGWHLVIVAALVLAGCGSPGGEPWATEAEEWFAGLDAAFDEQDHGQVLYYAPDAVLDSFDYSAQGRWPITMLQAGLYGVEREHGPLYVSRDSAVRTEIIMGYLPDIRLSHLAMTEDGIQRYTHLLHSRYWITIRHRQRDAMELADQVAADYIHAWNSDDPGAIERLYASGAILTDDLRGLSAEGISEIAGLADSSGPWVAQTNGEMLPQRVLELSQVEADAPAVFLTFELDRAELPTKVWLMVRSEAPCPGGAVVALDLDDRQLITAEQRFASVASMRGCVDPADAPQGWWTGLDLPLPFGERVTGSVDTGSGPVEIRNGWPPSDDAVRWAFGRFEAAGLPLPVVTAIAFDPFDDKCGDFRGYAEWREGTTEILICLDSSRIRQSQGDSDASRLPLGSNLLLHELGHAWVVNHTDEATREEFHERLGLDNWDDMGEPWRERGVEWAAETLAWGLQGAAVTSVPLGSPDCAVLAEGFRVLTGAEPISDCPGGG